MLAGAAAVVVAVYRMKLPSGAREYEKVWLGSRGGQDVVMINTQRSRVRTVSRYVRNGEENWLGKSARGEKREGETCACVRVVCVYFCDNVEAKIELPRSCTRVQLSSTSPHACPVAALQGSGAPVHNPPFGCGEHCEHSAMEGH